MSLSWRFRSRLHDRRRLVGRSFVVVIPPLFGIATRDSRIRRGSGWSNGTYRPVVVHDTGELAATRVEIDAICDRVELPRADRENLAASRTGATCGSIGAHQLQIRRRRLQAGSRHVRRWRRRRLAGAKKCGRNRNECHSPVQTPAHRCPQHVRLRSFPQKRALTGFAVQSSDSPVERRPLHQDDDLRANRDT